MTSNPSERRDLALAQFERALRRLEEALQTPRNAPLAVDGSIQRFEFCIEMAWKAVKHALAAEGVDTGTPRQAFEGAVAAGWIADDPAWSAMLRDRNESAHTYDEARALALYARLPGHIEKLKVLQAALRSL